MGLSAADAALLKNNRRANYRRDRTLVARDVLLATANDIKTVLNESLLFQRRNPD